MSTQLDAVTEHKVQWMIDGLCSEFNGRYSRAEIAATMHESVDQLAAGATVFTFLPVLAGRATRQRLNAPVARRGPAMRRL